MNYLELKIPPVIVTLIFGILIFCTNNIIPLERFNFSNIVSVASFLIGCLISVLGGIEFRKKSTTVNPTKPDTSSKLVTSGIYQFTRNPMYLGFLLCLLSEVIYFNNFIFGFFHIICFILYLNLFQIIPEERILTQIFGNEYTRYMNSSRRWI